MEEEEKEEKEEIIKKENRGGARAGSGPKKTTQQVSFNIDLDLLEFFKTLQNKSRFLNKLIREYLNQ